MRIYLLLIPFCLFSVRIMQAQDNRAVRADTVNNLVHTLNYKSSGTNELPEYAKYGNGQKSLLLIPGLGFDASVFDDFIKATQPDFTIYVVTLPGFGKTKAPEMPAAGTSYGQHSWSRSAEEGIMKLIEKEKISRPVLVGHFVSGTQIATEIAARYPKRIGGLILIGGAVKFISMEGDQSKDYDVADLIRFTDNYTAPVMFKRISKSAWDAGNYLPEVYSMDSTTGNKLWEISAAVPLPVMIRYLCEYIASDVSTYFNELQCPVLVLRPTFTPGILENPVNNYIRPQFINKWDSVKSLNGAVRVIDIDKAGVFVWKDAPDKTYSEIKKFVSSTR